MKPIELLKEFSLIFIVTFIVSALVSFIYSLIVHSEGLFDWAMAFRFSLIFGIIFTWLHFRNKKAEK